MGVASLKSAAGGGRGVCEGGLRGMPKGRNKVTVLYHQLMVYAMCLTNECVLISDRVAVATELMTLITNVH